MHVVLGANTIFTSNICIYFDVEGGKGSTIRLVSFFSTWDKFLGVHTIVTCLPNTLTFRSKGLLPYVSVHERALWSLTFGVCPLLTLHGHSSQLNTFIQVVYSKACIIRTDTKKTCVTMRFDSTFCNMNTIEGVIISTIRGHHVIASKKETMSLQPLITSKSQLRWFCNLKWMCTGFMAIDDWMRWFPVLLVNTYILVVGISNTYNCNHLSLLWLEHECAGSM